MMLFGGYTKIFDKHLACIKGGNLDAFSTHLKNHRLAHKYTRTELAAELDLCLSTIAKYEEGERIPSVETLIEISHLFNVSIDNLLS